MEKLAMSVSEAAKAIGISVAGMYVLIHQKGFPVKRIGNRYVIPVNALNKWLENGMEA